MYEMRMVVVASVLAGLLLLVALPASASAGLAGFQYQQEIVIRENSGETLRDYQVLVALAGSDFPEEAQADGDDIRFTDADGRELSYWIEEFDAGSEHATIWVKVPDISADGDAGIVMWYGNPGAESASDGEGVFEFFDDFDGNSLDTSKWYDTGRQGIYKIHNGIIEFVSDTEEHYKPKIASNKAFGNNIRIKAKIKPKCNEETDIVIGFAYNTDIGYYQWDIDPPCCNTYDEFCKNVGEYQTQLIGGSKHSSLDWHVVEIIHNNNEMIGKYNSETLKTSDNKYTHGKIGLRDDCDGSNSAAMFDWIFVTKYASSEPTVTLAPPAPATHTALAITKSPSPHSIRQFQETTIDIAIENSGTTDATDIEITDAIHPGFDLISGDFPNPKRYDLIRPGETRDLQYTIRAMESGTFTLDPATVTYADEDGNIQEAKSEPVSIKVIPSTEGSTAGGTSRSNPYVSTASVQLHGEKTDVVLGEDILLKLSAVNLITKPAMHVQVIIIPPSGMSVASSAFAKSGAGQYTTTYELEPGSGKDIEVAIRSNQVGEFDVNGRIIYYFGDDRDDAEDHTLTLPITVRAEPEHTADTSGSEEKGSSTPGFAAVVAVIGLLAVYLRRRI